MIRKIFSFVVGFLAFIVILLFFLVLNIKLAISNPAKISSYIKDSGASEMIVSYIKDNLIVANNVQLSEGTNLEAVNESVTSDSIDPLIDETVVRLSLALGDPSPKNLKFDLIYDTSDQTVFTTSTAVTETIDLRNNQYFMILTNLNLYLYILGGVVIFLTLIALLLLRDTQDRLAFFGRLLVSISLAIALIYIALVFLAPNSIRSGVDFVGFSADAKLANAVQKIWTYSIQQQFSLYLAEFLIIFAAGGVLAYLGGISKKSPLEGKMEIGI